MNYIDTHCHLDGEEFASDRDAVIQRAREAGCTAVFLPAIDAASCRTVLDVCRQYPDYCRPMLGLHPEEVRSDWKEQLEKIKQFFTLLPPEGRSVARNHSSLFTNEVIAIGEIGLDYYWSREFEREQLEAFEAQVRWAVELQLPLMIHCRKAQNEMVAIIKKYAHELPGGVFHCFTGNVQEARQLLEFDRFVLLERIVLETDAPYMAPVPLRGQRNEPAFIRHVITRLAEAYGVTEEEICRQTNANVARVFKVNG